VAGNDRDDQGCTGLTRGSGEASQSGPGSRIVGRGNDLQNAIARTSLSEAAEASALAIEKRRAELLASQEMLGAWERPWFAASPERRGALLTMEGAPSKAVLAANGFEQLQMPAEVVVGDFADAPDQTPKRAGRVDLAFVDGFHEGAATVRYHEAFKRVASPGAVLV
jgi:hypothetical protein